MFVKKEDISPDALIFDPDSGLLGFVCVTDLREGMVVGEKGLYDGTPRSATVLCLEDCDFACLLKKDYDRLLRDANKELIEEVRDFFYQHVFKRSVQRAVLASLGSDFCKKMVCLRKDKFVFRQDSPDTNVYIIKRGSVMLQSLHSVDYSKPFDNLPKRRKVEYAMNLITMGEGEIFGEEVLFDARKGREYSVKVCSDDCLMFTASCMTVRGHLLNNSSLKDYFRDIFEKKQAVRRQQIETIRKTMFTKDGEPRKDLSSLAAVDSGPAARVRDVESFNQKYKTELTDFKLNTPCARNPILVMKSDYEQTMMRCTFGNKEIEELRTFSIRDYLVNDKEFDHAAKYDRDYTTYRRKLIRKKYTEHNLHRHDHPMHLTNSTKTKATENLSRYNDSIEESISIKATISLRRGKLAQVGREEFSEDLRSPNSLRVGERFSQAASANEAFSVSLSQGKSPRQLDQSCIYPRVAMRSTFDHKSTSPKRMMAPSIPSLSSNRSQQLQDTSHVFRSTHLVGELIRFKKFSGAIDLNKTYSLRK